jgi:hypothetical protein
LTCFGSASASGATQVASGPVGFSGQHLELTRRPETVSGSGFLVFPPDNGAGVPITQWIGQPDPWLQGQPGPWFAGQASGVVATGASVRRVPEEMGPAGAGITASHSAASACEHANMLDQLRKISFADVRRVLEGTPYADVVNISNTYSSAELTTSSEANREADRARRESRTVSEGLLLKRAVNFSFEVVLGQVGSIDDDRERNRSERRCVVAIPGRMEIRRRLPKPQNCTCIRKLCGLTFRQPWIIVK